MDQHTQLPLAKTVRSGSLAGAQPPLRALRQLLWLLPFDGVFLPIVLLGIYAYRIAEESVRSLVEAEHLTATYNLSELITHDLNESVVLARAIASVPMTVQAVQDQNAFTITSRLKAVVVAFKNIDHAMVVDASGNLWSEFPTSSGSYGVDLSGNRWFEAIRDQRRPFIDGVTLRNDVFTQKPIVTIAVPIRSSTGAFLGGLAFEYHADQITTWLQNVKIAHGGNLFVVDQRGALVAHPSYVLQNAVYSGYSNVGVIQEALGGRLHTSEYDDPLSGQHMIGTFLPVAVGSNMWVIVAQQPSELAFAQLKDVRRNITVAAGSLSLVTLVLIIALAATSARNIRLNRDLQNKNATLRDITSFVSHQLRAPITAMRWSLESLLDGDCGEMIAGVKKEIQSVYEVVVQSAALINDILNVSRLDRGVVEVTLSPTPLVAVAERAIRDYRMPCTRAGLSLEIVEDAKGVTVSADADKFAEAVSNAVSNALKHTKSGGIVLRVRKDDRFGYIDVTDTGEGMSPETLSTLFSRVGTKGSNTDASQSTGLGLFIARQFTRLMGGDVTVASTVGKGSTFTYSVPLGQRQ